MIKAKKKYIWAAFTVCVLLGTFVYYNFFYQTKEEIPLVPIREAEGAASAGTVVVYVSGAVEVPGVYNLPSGSRAVDAVQAAGNLLPYADGNAVNLAAEVHDGDHIIIPFDFNPAEAELEIDYVNINTATVRELEALPGVGKSTAEKIVEYRNKEGLFKSVDDLKNINGIGEGKFLHLRKYLTI